MLKRIVAGVLCAAGLAFAADAATVTVHGSTTVASNILTPHKGKIEQASGHSLKIVANGTGRGIADLVGGKADLAMISAPLPTVVAKANKKKPGSVDGSKLVAHQIGATRVAFAVHPSNPVKNLSLAQVGDIMAGKIKNWSEVGGPDKPIVIVSESKGGGVRSMVEKELLSGGELGGQVRELPNAPQVVKVVAQVPNAIGIAIDATIDSSVMALSTDGSIEQPLILVSIGQPTAEQAQVIEAARQAGS